MKTKQRVSSITSLKASGRITPREVVEAYERTGKTPIFGRWTNSTGGVCGLVAVAHDKGHYATVSLDADAIIRAVNALLEGRMPPAYDPWSYRDGFAEGFDGCYRNPDWPRSEAEDKGYRDGLRARRFVLAKLGKAGG